MKILKITVAGLPLLGSECSIDFTAQQRVSDDNAEKMGIIFATKDIECYQNNVLSFIGINASGKTTLLKLVSFVCRMLNNEPLNGIGCREVFDGLANGQEAILDTYFYAKNGTVNLLRTVIGKKNGKLVILSESIKSKPINSIKRKNQILDLEKSKLTMTRDNDEDFLLDDVSIMVAFNKRNHEELSLTDMLNLTNTNQLTIVEDCPAELIAFFDPSVEYLRVRKSDKETTVALKFKGKDELILHQISELNRYLSSGTIKGINTFLGALQTFETGGYLIVDELENHFNQEIVSTIIRFYMDKDVNPLGAVLVFSTHYSELLDEFERNDNIYIVRNRSGITAENLSLILKRNDIKKSEAYQSGFLEGTVPVYKAYKALKDSLIGSRGEDN